MDFFLKNKNKTVSVCLLCSLTFHLSFWASKRKVKLRVKLTLQLKHTDNKEVLKNLEKALQNLEAEQYFVLNLCFKPSAVRAAQIG